MTSDNKIDILIMKFFSGEALPKAAMELEDWLNVSPENRHYFNNYSEIFGMTADITSNDKSRAWKDLGAVIDKEESKPKSTKITWRLMGVAASVVLLLAIRLAINNYKKEPETITYRAEASSKKISLKDNSEVMVLPNSSIAITKEYGVNNRKIKLDGSATFSVIHNPSLPLIVDMNTFHIKDIGTMFSVITSPVSDTIFISVADGEIAIYDDFGSSGNAGVGENVTYIKSRKKLQVFHTQHQIILTTPKRSESNAHVKKIDSAKNTQLPALPDTTQQNYSLAEPPSNEGHTAPGRYGRRAGDSTQSERVVTDLVIDGLIIRGQPLSFTLSDTAFILNGKKQSNEVFERYREKYGGKGSGHWSWGHGENQPPKH